MKRIFTITILNLICFTGYSQQQPQLSQYMQNNFLINPAVAGIESYADVRASYRNQWAGVEGAPVTYYVSVNAALNKQERSTLTLKHSKKNGSKIKRGSGSHYRVSPHHGIGAIAKVDMAGLLRTSTLNVNYAYHLPLTRSINLASGLYSGLTQIHINTKDISLQTPDDPFLNEDGLNVMKLDLGVGIWLYSSSFFLGLSGTQLIHSRNDVYSKDEGPLALLQPHYYATTGYRIPIRHNLDVTPSIMLKFTDYQQTALDVNAKVLYNRRIWAGGSYRHKDAAAIMTGIYLNHLIDVSYSYDFVISEMNKTRANSHEVVVGFKLNNPNKVLCPQWVW